MKRRKKVLSILLAGTLICSGGARYISAMSFPDETENMTVSDGETEYEEDDTEDSSQERPSEDVFEDDTGQEEDGTEDNGSGDFDDTDDFQTGSDGMEDSGSEGDSSENKPQHTIQNVYSGTMYEVKVLQPDTEGEETEIPFWIEEISEENNAEKYAEYKSILEQPETGENLSEENTELFEWGQENDAAIPNETKISLTLTETAKAQCGDNSKIKVLGLKKETESSATAEMSVEAEEESETEPSEETETPITEILFDDEIPETGTLQFQTDGYTAFAVLVRSEEAGSDEDDGQEDNKQDEDTQKQKSCIASFSFDNSENGLSGRGAKAEVIDGSKSVILSGNGYSGRALYLDGTGESALKVTKENGKSLLTGVDELTVSYYSRPTDNRTNWGFYAAQDEESPNFNKEHYLGIFEKDNNSIIGVHRFNNNGNRPHVLTASINADGWHHIVVVFSGAEVSDTSSEDNQNTAAASEDGSIYATEDMQAESKTYKVRIYVDGKKKAEVENPYALTDVLGDNSILQIGKANWGKGEYYKGYIDEYRIYNYAMTEEEVGSLTSQPSQQSDFGKTLYFDNVLSRLEGVEPDTSDGIKGNGTEESGLYYSYDDGIWYSMSQVTDANLGDNVSYVSLWKATVPEQATSIRFRGWYKGYTRGAMTYTTGYRTSEIQEIPKQTNSADAPLNCYYGNPMVYQLDNPLDKPSGTVLNGHWANVNEINREGQQSAEIPEGTFSRNKNLYYGNSSFFDYYSDYELNGAKLSQSNATNEDGYNDQPLYAWNLAIDRYYKEESNVKPLYFGGARMMLGNKDLHSRLTGYDQRIAGGNGFSGASVKKENNNSFFPNKGLLSTTTLGETGLKLTNSNLTVPYFDADYLLGKKNEEKTQFASVYQNIAFPFKMSDSGYWTFDSSQDEYALQMKYDKDKQTYFLDQTGKPVKYGNSNYFFPFNTAGEHGGNSAQQLDYMFGSVIEVPFALTENHRIKKENGSETNTVFTFSGDDDVWVFLEGPNGVQHLVLDIGGSHGAVSGAIDFTTGLVATSGNWSALGDNPGEATAMDKDKFIEIAESEGVESIITKYDEYIWSDNLSDFGINWGDYQPYKEYKIKVYYMERGLDQSNLRITFNFVNNNHVEVEKTWSDGNDDHVNDKVTMTLYQVSSNSTGTTKVVDKTDIGEQYVGNAKLGDEEKNGHVELSQSNNWTCRWENLKEKPNDSTSTERYSYYIAENVPKGYEAQYYDNTNNKKLDPVELTLKDGTKVNAVLATDTNVSIRVENKKLANLIIKKKGADLSGTSNDLAGVRFELYQSNDEWEKIEVVPKEEATSDKQGKVEFNNLLPGEYLMYETENGNEYYKPQAPWKITVAGDGTISVLDQNDNSVDVSDSQNKDTGNKDNEITVTNYHLLNLQILKIDADDSDKKLADVEFKLEKQESGDNWTEIATGVTDKNGGISDNNFNGLQAGTYRLTETKAPSNYEGLEKPIEFTISYVNNKVEIEMAEGTPKAVEMEEQNDNISFKLTVKNSYGYHMPETGGSGTQKFLLSGCLFLIAGLLYGYNLKRRRERRRIRRM